MASQNGGLPGAPLRLSAGAWASGMGGAAAADPQFMISWYNPANLSLLRERRASLGAGLRSLGRSEGWASIDFRVPPRMGMGLSFVYRGDPFLDDMYDGYYDQGTVVEEKALGPMSYSFLNLKIGVGYLVSKKLSMGASVAIMHQSLPTTPQGDGVLNSTSTSIGAFDIAATYKLNKELMLAAVLKNLGARNSWTISSDEGFDQTIEEEIPPSIVLAGSYKGRFLERGLLWNLDLVNYVFDSDWAFFEHPEMVISTGVQWDFRDDLLLRAGLGDIEVSSEIYRRSEEYWDGFSPRMTLGFTYRLDKLHQGMLFNYALTSDRIWSGVDQQFDLTLAF